MATTLQPARPFPGAGSYQLDAGCYDEALAPTGTPRPPYADVLDALARQDLVVLRERVRSNAAALGLDFGPGRPIAVDPVPRLLDGGAWERLEAGLVQRARALNAFLLDVYGEQRILVAGLDLVRDPNGEMLVLEDNLRMPSGATYAVAVREAVAAEIDATARPRAIGGYTAALGAAIAAAAPARELLADLVAVCRPHAEALGCREELERVLGLGERTGAQRQLELSRRLGSLPRVVAVLADEFLAR